MNAKTTETRTHKTSTRRPLLGALLALTVAATAAPGVSRADDERTERAVPRLAATTETKQIVTAKVSAQAEEQAYAVVRRNVSALHACYLRAGSSGGKVEVSFDIGPTGRATDIQVKAPALEGTSIPGCVSATVARWPFRASVGAKVSFPLLFVQG